jgi:uncharacterized membrane protein HdeD (DUF308 family)
MHKIGNMWIVQGIASLVFGILTLLSPGASIAALVTLFGIFALADGMFLFGFAFWQEGPKGRYVVRGLLSIAAATFAFIHPTFTAVSLYVLIAAWAITTGLSEILIAFTMGKEARADGLLLAGVLSLAFGIMLFTLPFVGFVALVTFIALYALINGATLIGAGSRLRHLFRAA